MASLRPAFVLLLKVFTSSAFATQERVVFSKDAERKLLPNQGDDFIIVPLADLQQGDEVEVATSFGNHGMLDVRWQHAKVASKNNPEDLQFTFVPPDPRAGELFQYHGLLVRRFPWRYVNIHQNDTIEVCTLRGWEPALVTQDPLHDALTLRFADGTDIASVQPHVRLGQGGSESPPSPEKIDVGEKIKVQTSRGWEIASVVGKSRTDVLHLEMYPDGQHVEVKNPWIYGPLHVEDEDLSLWKKNHELRAQVAELKMLKHVVEQISSAPLAECGRSFFPARIEGQKTYGLG